MFGFAGSKTSTLFYTTLPGNQIWFNMCVWAPNWELLERKEKCWTIEQITDWMAGRRNDHKNKVWQKIEQLNARFHEWMIEWQNERMDQTTITESMNQPNETKPIIHRIIELLNEWINEPTNPWINEEMKQWVNVRKNEPPTSQQPNERTNTWINEGMKEWMNEWMNEWMKEWRNEGMKEWRNEGMKECRNAGMKEWRNEGMKELKNWRMKEFHDQWWNLSASSLVTILSFFELPCFSSLLFVNLPRFFFRFSKRYEWLDDGWPESGEKKLKDTKFQRIWIKNKMEKQKMNKLRCEGE